jgi:hypothetical protein
MESIISLSRALLALFSSGGSEMRQDPELNHQNTDESKRTSHGRK